MGFIDDDRKALPLGILHFFIDHRELLQSRYNNPFSGVQRVPQIFGGLLLINRANGTERMIKPGDGFLQLRIEILPVCNDHNRGENRLVRVIVQRGQPVSRPGNGVGLSGTGGVLNQIVRSGTVLADIKDDAYFK